MYIPLTKPYWDKFEEQAAVKALRTTSGTGDGPNSRELVKLLKKITGSKYVLPVTSCTHGLELAVSAMIEDGKLKAGDEVIMPSFTMTSTANAVVLSGAQPVFADVDPVYFNIDPEDLKKRITPKTRGIIVVHYAGMACPMKEIIKIARVNKLFIIEDAAHAIGVKYFTKSLGTRGDIGVYSFHGTKNVSCGEGGVVLTDNRKLADIMEVYRANGTNRKAFLEGLVAKYSWVNRGTSYFLSDILSAVAVSQIKKLKIINSKRTEAAQFYSNAFKDMADKIQLPGVSPGTSPNWHIYAIRLKSEKDRLIFIRKMKDKGIEVSPHYVPLHSSAMGRKLSRSGKNKKKTGFSKLPVTDLVSRTIVRLPIYPSLTKSQIRYIIDNAKLNINNNIK